MSEKKKKITGKSILSCIVSLVVGIAGVLGAQTVFKNDTRNENSNANNNSNNQKQEQSITININGEEVELNQGNAQNVYNKIEDEKNELNSQVGTLQEENENLNTELSKYKEYGTDALVSKNQSYDEKKVSLFAFDTVEGAYWEPNEGSLNDSLGNTYNVSLDYIVLNGDSWATYYTNQKFSKLEFKLAPHESMEQGTSCVVKVFADDSLVFTSDEFSRTCEAEKYTVPLKNAKFVKIVCENSWNARLLLLDATLIK